MNPSHFTKGLCRPCEHLDTLTALYPSAWRMAEAFRSDRGISLPSWPAWCYLPLAAWHAILKAEADVNALDLSLLKHVGPLSALGTWRINQGIYRFDPALYNALLKTPFKKNLMPELFLKLPSWCIYIELPGMISLGTRVYGVWAHLEYDFNHGTTELRLLFDTEQGLNAIPILLGAWSLAESISHLMQLHPTRSVDNPAAAIKRQEAAKALCLQLEPIISLLLYICHEPTEIAESGATALPPQASTAFEVQSQPAIPAQKATLWEVGVLLGDALRMAYHLRETRQSPEVLQDTTTRRAHWHAYRSKSTEGKDASLLRWLPPTSTQKRRL